MRKLILLFVGTILLASCKQKANEEAQITPEVKQEQRIISLNGAVTEVIAALGEDKNIVGVDVTSTYPANIKEQSQDLGHVSKLSLESILSLKPTVIYVSEKELTEDLKKQLEATDIKIELINQVYTIEGTKDLIKTIATSLGNDNYQPLLDKIDNDLKQVKPLTDAPKVLFVYARGASTLLVGGSGTPTDAIITLAGGQNAAKEISDFKPLTAESLMNANPDYILMFDKGLESLGGVEGALQIPSLNKTNAGINKQVIALDGQLLSGFGPRIGEAVVALNSLLSK